MRVPSSSAAATTYPLSIYHTTATMSREALKPWNDDVNYLSSPCILSSPPSLPKNVKNNIPRIASWMSILVPSAPPPNHHHHHHHLQWYSTNLVLYLICLCQHLQLHLQCSNLTIIMAPQINLMLSLPGQSQLVTQPSGIRKHSKNQLNIWQIFLTSPHWTL